MCFRNNCIASDRIKYLYGKLNSGAIQHNGAPRFPLQIFKRFRLGKTTVTSIHGSATDHRPNCIPLLFVDY